jgi:hypothetical protein
MKLVRFIGGKLGRPQFRLRVLFALVAMASIPVAIVANREHAYRVRLAAVDVIRAGGPLCEVSVGTDEHDPCSGASTLGYDKGVLERDDVVTSINPTGYNRIALSSEQLSAILCFPTVRCLYLSEAEISEAQLAEIATLPSLAILNLGGSTISDEGVRHLGAMRSLRCLDLARTKISDRALEYLEPLRELEVLDLDGTNVTDDGVRHLTGCRSLRCLRLGHTHVSDGAMEHIACLPALDSLSVYDDDVGDGAICDLARLAKLSDLDLRATRITDDGLQSLARVESLRTLLLAGRVASDVGPAGLSRGTANITADGVARLRMLRPDLDVTWPD